MLLKLSVPSDMTYNRLLHHVSVHNTWIIGNGAYFE
jgi:hypothetical protein